MVVLASAFIVHPDPLYVPPEKRPADWKKYYISQDKTS
jgi:hypothetical protein